MMSALRTSAFRPSRRAIVASSVPVNISIAVIFSPFENAAAAVSIMPLNACYRSSPRCVERHALQNPHEVSDKRTRVQKMFAAIAPSYDLNNRLHSLWMDQRWRRKAVKLANPKSTDVVVDVACGTGDLTLAFYSALLLTLVHEIVV